MTTEQLLKIDKSIFVRFRSGTRVNINPDMRNQINRIVKELEKEPDHNKVFEANISMTFDNAGPGISPESTWPAVIKEIFFNYERDQLLNENKAAILEILSIMTRENGVSENWNTLKSCLLQNADSLSNWNQIKEHRLSSYSPITRTKEGEYLTEDGMRATGSGALTSKEDRFQFIAGDITGDYGRIHLILKLIAMVDIADGYIREPQNFPEKLVCSLYDHNSDRSSFLHWRWWNQDIYDFSPTLWRPQSCFSDPVWLAYDLLSELSATEKIDPSFRPKITGVDGIKQFHDAFNGYVYQYEVALETDLALGDEPDVYFDFMGRKIRWVNGTTFLTPVLIVPSKKQDGSDGIDIAKKFLSQLAKDANHSIAEMFTSGGPLRYEPFIKQRRTLFGLKLDPRYLINQDSASFSDKRWFALALNREALNSKSLYHSFLNYFKIVELPFGGWDKDKGKKCKAWIDKTLNGPLAPSVHEWKQKLQKGQSAGAHLYNSGRCAVAHVEDKKGKRSNPDNLADFLRLREDLPIIQELANEIFKQEIL